MQDVQNEQTLVARVLHSLHAPDPDMQLQLLQVAQQQLFLGGMRRLRHTLPALGFATLRLVRRVTGGEAAKTGAFSWWAGSGSRKQGSQHAALAANSADSGLCRTALGADCCRVVRAGRSR
eukprot:scaffold139550_cov23-Tisochrysis_lutea.AAC.4